MTNSTWRLHNTVKYLVKIKGRPATSHERRPVRFHSGSLSSLRFTYTEKLFTKKMATISNIYVLWKTFNENLFHFFPRAHTWEQKSGCETSIVLSHFFREFTPGTVLRVFGYCNCVKRFCCDAVVQKEVETLLQILQRRNAWYTWCDFEASIALRDAFV